MLLRSLVPSTYRRVVAVSRCLSSITAAASASSYSYSSSKDKGLDPEKVVSELDKHIIGQYTAKRSVAIAFRNRYRRLTIQDKDVQKEIMPANILMKGPTGCGKTEIARRIANLSSSPFIKVEATRYTEVGIVGANTNSMIKDLLDIAINLQRDNAKAKHADKAIEESESFVLDILDNSGQTSKRAENEKRLREGQLDEKIIEVPMDIYRQAMQMNKSKSATQNAHEDGTMGGMGEDMSNVINMLGDYMNRSGMGRGGKGEKKSETMKVTVAEALQIYQNYYYSRNIDESSIIRMAREATEQSGIVFIDEIDKLAVSSDSSGGGGVSRWSHREGVQKELLTLLEGETVQTKHGPIKTHHILFIAAGAFHNTSVSDLMPELQGRLPVRVELKALSERDMRRVLSEKKYNLLNESKALLSAEGVNLEFTEDAIDEIARFATVLNSSRGNIGARRLTNVMHTVLEDISFLAHRMSGTTQTIDGKYVQARMKFNDPSSSEENLHKYII